MSKPVAQILNRERLMGSQSFKDGWVKKIDLDTWMKPYYRFIGLARVATVRIASHDAVKARAVYFKYWPNTWLSRLGNFLFGWIE